MTLVRPQRVYLDTSRLIELAKDDEGPECRRLKHKIHQEAAVVVLVTYDHVAEFCAYTNRHKALEQARFVDTLKPLWLPRGMGIYHREAYSEYLRLLGNEPLPPAEVRASLLEAERQWLGDFPCLPQRVIPAQLIACLDKPNAFSQEVCYAHLCEKHNPQMHAFSQNKEAFAQGRNWLHSRDISEPDWDAIFHSHWIQDLTEDPLTVPLEEAIKLCDNAQLKRMPAWRTRFGIERIWQADKMTKPKAGDLMDMVHVAALPYVHHFVADAQMASLITQAKLGPDSAKVHTTIKQCLEALSPW